MTLEFEGIFLVSWIFRIVILSYVTNQRINLYYLLLPFIFLGIYIINYDIVFWGEIFLLPLSLIFVKNKFNWNWSQYIFYSFFPFVIFEIFSNFANLYDRFLFRLSAAQWYNFFWSSWIDYCFGFLFCFGFFKLLLIDFKGISEELNRQLNFKKHISLFCYSLIFYVVSVYLLDNLIHLSEYGYIVSSIDFVYLRRNILIIYLIFTIGIIFKMNDQAKKNKEKELQESKDNQLKNLTSYSHHIESLYKEIRSFRHDYTNILVSLNESIKKRDIDGVERIYNAVLKESDKSFYNSQYDIAKLVHLKNLAMKSVVSAKLIEAQNRGIDVSVEIAEPIGTPQIDLVDFITILSVFLDNAIEAAVNAEAPRISFTYFQENENKILVIYNTTADYKIPTKNIFQYGVSTKGEGRGIGLSNVKQILSKYPKVTLETKSIDHEFTHELKMYEG